MASSRNGGPQPVAPGDEGLVARIKRVEIDVPRSAGYYGGIAVAVAAGLIEPPLGLFVAAVPLVKMLARPAVTPPLRAIGLFLDGMAKPVGGEGDGYVRLTDPPPEIRQGGRRSVRRR